MRIRANKIKEYILEMINEAGVGGISMSHLPKKLKKALGYKINVMELGYAKLKDLVLTLPGVSVEVRENNHSYAMID